MSYRIHKYSHHFIVQEPNGYLQNAINDFSRAHLLQIQRMTTWNNKVVTKEHKMYGVRTINPLIFRFHIAQLDQFLTFMYGKGFKNPIITEEPMYTPVKATFDIVSDKQPWNNQPAIIDFLTDDGFKKVIELQAGQGKTLCALFAVERIGMRAALDIKPMYIDRWLDDLARAGGIYNLTPKEITVVRGSKALSNLIETALTGEMQYKFIVFSNKTLAIYYKEYITGQNMDKYHNVLPYDLMKVLGVGVRVTDEAHQDFHACFRADLFTHVPKTISLSATLEPDDIFLQQMYEVVYPRELRYGGSTYHKYVDVISVPFKIDREVKAKVRFNQKGMMSYNQNVYEESILDSKKRTSNYMHMVTDLTTKYFINKRHANYRLLIFAGRVDMCVAIVKHLSEVFPKLKIGKYTEEESYDVLDELDIIVSTPISAGTAVDISELQVCLNLVALGSSQANLQMIGRLRELRGLDINPLFIYIYCTDIEKHIEYHQKKRDKIFLGKTLSYIDLQPANYFV